MAKVPVHELRKLILPLETAVDAVLELDSEQGGALSFGVIVEAQIESEPEPGLALGVQRRGSETVERRKFGLPVLAAAFIRYCWKCRIPLPRHGSKRIDISPEGFVFTIEGSVEVIRRHGPLPQAQGVAARRETKPASADPATPQAEVSPEKAAPPSAPLSEPQAAAPASSDASEPAQQAVA